MRTLKQSVSKTANDGLLSKRFFAYLFDWYVGALITGLPISLTALKLTGSMQQQNILEFSYQTGLIVGFMALVFGITYFIFIPSFIFKGQTIGKRIFKIKVVQKNEDPATFKHILLRNGLGIILIEGVLVSVSTIWHQILMMITGIDFVRPLMYMGFVITLFSIGFIFYKNEQRALHDYIGGTKVIHS